MANRLPSAKRDRTRGLLLAILAGTLWSFGALIVRHMVDAPAYPWHYLFYRGLTIATLLTLFLMVREGRHVVQRYRKIGLAGLIGACGLVTAFSGFIWALALTTAANTLFMFAAMPFIAAFLSIVLLGEQVRPLTWTAMAVALLGIVVMVAEGLEAGQVLGNLSALASACGFAVFSVTLRWRKETPQFATVALAGALCALVTLSILFMDGQTLAMPLRNVYLSILHGFLVAVGLILYSIGAKYLPTAELTLLSLMEIVGGVLWVYLPIFGIHEVPSVLTVIGGALVLIAVVMDSVHT